jgi:hypothetical protein
MPTVEAIWRTARVTTYGLLERALADSAQAQQMVEEALAVLRRLVSESEYQQMAAECARGERELRVDNGFIVTTLSPRH